MNGQFSPGLGGDAAQGLEGEDGLVAAVAPLQRRPVAAPHLHPLQPRPTLLLGRVCRAVPAARVPAPELLLGDQQLLGGLGPEVAQQQSPAGVDLHAGHQEGPGLEEEQLVQHAVRQRGVLGTQQRVRVRDRGLVRVRRERQGHQGAAPQGLSRGPGGLLAQALHEAGPAPLTEGVQPVGVLGVLAVHVGHVLHHGQGGHPQLREHGDPLGGVGQGQRVRGGHQHRPRQAQPLGQRDVHIPGAGGHVHHQVVQVAPLGGEEHLVDDLGGDGSPHHGRRLAARPGSPCPRIDVAEGQHLQPPPLLAP
mmetsp:Transcript_2687/g.3677  ORF Transcript_2687/g.3677 Transcript_2687/m.3677 type:complete len:306 (-) Transcript_2687:703-1620(-)